MSFPFQTTHFQSLSFLNYGRPPPMDLESLTNNGHTVTFSLDNANDPIYPKVGNGFESRHIKTFSNPFNILENLKISDGGLPGSYRFS